MAKRETRLTGLNPLSYIGVETPITFGFFTVNRAPTSSDYANYNIGDMWLDDTSRDIWILTDKVGEAVWVRFATNLNALVSYFADTGFANPVLGSIYMLGGNGVSTVADGVSSLVAYVSNLDDGHTYIGDGTSMADGTITCIDGTLDISTSAHTIDIKNIGGADITGFHTDSGDAIKVDNIISILGSSNISVTGLLNNITIALAADPNIVSSFTMTAFGEGIAIANLAGNVTSTNGANGNLIIASTGGFPIWAPLVSTYGSIRITNSANGILLENLGQLNLRFIKTDSGTVEEVGNNINILGSSNFTTSGAGNAITVTLNNSISYAGTFQISTLTAGVLQTSSNGTFFSSKGTNGQILLGGGTAPAWRNLQAGNSSIVITNGANSIDIKAIAPVGTQKTRIRTWNDGLYAVASGGIINIAGGPNITAVAAGHTVILNMDDDVVLANNLVGLYGGTVSVGARKGVLSASADGTLTSSAGNDGRILMWPDSGLPSWVFLTSLGGTLSIVNGINSITISDPALSGAIDRTTFNASGPYEPSGSPYTGGSLPIYKHSQSDVDTQYVRFDPGQNITLTGPPSSIPYTFEYTSEITGAYNLQMSYLVYRTNLAPGRMFPNVFMQIQIITSHRTFYKYKKENIVNGIALTGSATTAYADTLNLGIVEHLDVGDTVRVSLQLDSNWHVDKSATFVTGFFVGF